MIPILQQYAESSIAYNRALEHELQQRWNMSLREYSILETLYEIIVLVLIAYSIYAGADPTISVVVGAVLIQGPRVLAYILILKGDFNDETENKIKAVIESDIDNSDDNDDNE